LREVFSNGEEQSQDQQSEPRCPTSLLTQAPSSTQQGEAVSEPTTSVVLDESRSKTKNRPVVSGRFFIV
jgi:hypothetical protein